MQTSLIHPKVLFVINLKSYSFFCLLGLVSLFQGVVNPHIFFDSWICGCLCVWVYLSAFTDGSGNGLLVGIPHLLLPNRTLIIFGQSYALPAQVTNHNRSKAIVVISMPLFPSLPCS